MCGYQLKKQTLRDAQNPVMEAHVCNSSIAEIEATLSYRASSKASLAA